MSREKNDAQSQYLFTVNPALAGYYPKWVDELAADATVEGSIPLSPAKAVWSKAKAGKAKAAEQMKSLPHTAPALPRSQPSRPENVRE